MSSFPNRHCLRAQQNLCNDLWDQAYLALKAKDQNLVESCEKILSLESEAEGVIFKDNVSTTTPSAASHGLEREEQMLKLIKKKLQSMDVSKWRRKLGTKSVEIREKVDKLVDTTLFIKDYVATVLSPSTRAALAWAGICILLSLVLNSSQQHHININGLEYISCLIHRYYVREQLRCSQYSSSREMPSLKGLFKVQKDLEAQAVKLYTLVLEYQIRSLRKFAHPFLLSLGRDMIKADNWEELLKGVKEYDLVCQRSFQVIDLEKLHRGFAEQDQRLERLLDAYNLQMQGYEQLHAVAKKTLKAVEAKSKDQEATFRTEEEIRCHQVFRTTGYEESKNRNPESVEGFTLWLLGYPKYRLWESTLTAALLWISANPGSGKSVLSKSLVDKQCHLLFLQRRQHGSTECNKCIVCHLHQLFSAKRELLKYAMPDLRLNGAMLPKLLPTLWSILLRTAADPQAGQVFCILDVLDECEEQRRFELIESFNHVYGNLTHEESGARLKFSLHLAHSSILNGASKG
ncbi:MAG: hypothetical protein MMC33_003781 [Icmadophila ericetorum]|nr:hypothetical protein [Icmadophila ericetorum]